MAAKWIATVKAAQEQESATDQMESVRRSLAGETIRSDGPVFWDALLRCFKEQCEEMQEIGFKAQAYELPNPFYGQEKTYRVDVQAESDWPETAFAMLVYTVGSSKIKVTGDLPKLSEFIFRATDNGLRAAPNRDLRLLEVEDLAGYVLSGLTEVIKKARTGYRRP